MLSIKTKLENVYNKTPLFYKIYGISSCITYYYVPSARKLILTNTAALAGSEIIQCTENYVKHTYPDKETLCDIVSTVNIATKIGVLGYVSAQLGTLKDFHKPAISFMYSVNEYLLNSVVNGAYWSVVYGSATTFATWCASQIFMQKCVGPLKRELYDIINYFNGPNGNRIRATINDAIGQLTPLLTMSGIVQGNRQRVFTEIELETIAPVRCKGKANMLGFKSEVTCAVCTDVCNEIHMHRTLPCAHTFHVHCIDNWLLKKSTVCPMCRTNAYTAYEAHISTNPITSANTTENN